MLRIQILLELCFAALLAAGCGAGEHLQVPPEEDSGAPLEVNQRLNVCPSFGSSLVIPQLVNVGASAAVVVFATDVDGPSSALRYRWSAASGSFSDPESAQTSYTCTESGPLALKVSAWDVPGCEARLDLHVTCSDN